jgi:tetratricopeptide (TPR) repeat protein
MTDNFKELLAEGHRERQQNRLSASRAVFIDVVRKASEEGDRSSLAEALEGLAEAENGIGNCEAARHHYANAAALYRQIGPPKMLAGTLRHEADLWMQINRPAEAEPLYLEAEKVYRQNGEESALDLAHTLRALALIREAKGATTPARSLWREACEIYARLEVKDKLAECDKKLSL